MPLILHRPDPTASIDNMNMKMLGFTTRPREEVARQKWSLLHHHHQQQQQQT
jgi:hypothetical protein